MSGYGEIPLVVPVPWGAPSQVQLHRYGTQPIYGSYRLHAEVEIACHELSVFGAGRGETANGSNGFGRALGTAETNLYEAKRTPFCQTFDIGGVAWEIRGGKADREMAAAQAFWSWSFVQSNINQGPSARRRRSRSRSPSATNTGPGKATTCRCSGSRSRFRVSFRVRVRSTSSWASDEKRLRSATP